MCVKVKTNPYVQCRMSILIRWKAFSRDRNTKERQKKQRMIDKRPKTKTTKTFPSHRLLSDDITIFKCVFVITSVPGGHFQIQWFIDQECFQWNEKERKKQQTHQTPNFNLGPIPKEKTTTTFDTQIDFHLIDYMKTEDPVANSENMFDAQKEMCCR